jgi:hypothetical protein
MRILYASIYYLLLSIIVIYIVTTLLKYIVPSA